MHLRAERVGEKGHFKRTSTRLRMDGSSVEMGTERWDLREENYHNNSIDVTDRRNYAGVNDATWQRYGAYTICLVTIIIIINTIITIIQKCSIRAIPWPPFIGSRSL